MVNNGVLDTRRAGLAAMGRLLGKLTAETAYASSQCLVHRSGIGVLIPAG
jgi:hypothetical protein